MTIQVCIGSACHLKGSYDIINKLKELTIQHHMEEQVKVKAAFCLGNCKGAVSVRFDDKIYSIQPETAESFFQTVVYKRMTQ